MSQLVNSFRNNTRILLSEEYNKIVFGFFTQQVSDISQKVNLIPYIGNQNDKLFYKTRAWQFGGRTLSNIFLKIR